MHREISPSTPRAELLLRLRRTTGMGWFESVLFAWGMQHLLLERIVQAHETQNRDREDRWDSIHDPIEDQPQFSVILKAADREVAAELQGQPLRRGFCHRVWYIKKRILQERYGVQWFSPAEMNPGTRFD
jgi:hypothetical protein